MSVRVYFRFNTFLRYLPVYDFGEFATSSGVPFATPVAERSSLRGTQSLKLSPFKYFF